MWPKLAWRNLTRDRRRCAVTIFGMGFAVFIMLFQTGLFVGFTQAASHIIRAMDGDLLISGRGASCLEYGFPIEARYGDIARSVREVRATGRVIIGPTSFKRPNGSEVSAFLIGTEPSPRDELPHPTLVGESPVTAPESVVVDRSNLDALGLTFLPAEVEINRHRTSVLRSIDGFGSFLGAPFIFSDDREVARLLNYPDGYVTFLTVQLRPGADIELTRARLQSLLPNVDVHPKVAFASQASAYWVLQTGAGGALLTSAFLGLLLGVVFVSQTMYASTLEKLDEYATMRAMGASKLYVLAIVVAQAMMAGVFGAAGGLAAASVLIVQARRAIPWVAAPAWLFLVMIAAALLMSRLASVASARAATRVDPARVFRG
jgi:putative ABC transport system permease protein